MNDFEHNVFAFWVFALFAFGVLFVIFLNWVHFKERDKDRQKWIQEIIEAAKKDLIQPTDIAPIPPCTHIRTNIDEMFRRGIDGVFAIKALNKGKRVSVSIQIHVHDEDGTGHLARALHADA